MPFVQTNPIQMLDNKANGFVIREKPSGINYVEIDTLDGTEIIRLRKQVYNLIDVGVGTATPGVNIGGGTITATGRVLEIENTGGQANLIIDGDVPIFTMADRGGDPDKKILSFIVDGGTAYFVSLEDDGTPIKTGIIRMDMTTGNVGIGITAAQKFEIGSNDNSDRISIYHNNTNPIIEWDDGLLIVRSVEAVDSNTILQITPQGNGYGQLTIRDGPASGGNNTTFVQNFNSMTITNNHATGNVSIIAGGAVFLQSTAESDVRCFSGAADNETPYFGVSGRRLGGTRDEIQIAVGAHADQVGSIYGCANGYYIDAKIGIAETVPDSKLCINIGTGTGKIISFKTDTVQPFTSIAEADTIGFIEESENALGGVRMVALNAGGSANGALRLEGYYAQADATAIIQLMGAEWDSGTGAQAIGDADELASFINYTTEIITIKGNGDFATAGKVTGDLVMPTDSAPSNPVKGSFYYDTATLIFYIYDGSVWDYEVFTTG